MAGRPYNKISRDAWQRVQRATRTVERSLQGNPQRNRRYPLASSASDGEGDNGGGDFPDDETDCGCARSCTEFGGIDCANLAVPAVSNWTFQAPDLTGVCPEAGNAGIDLAWVADCEWQSGTYACGSGATVRWTLTVGATWATLELKDTDTGDVLVAYRVRTEEFRPVCGNTLQVDLTARPAPPEASCRICLKPGLLTICTFENRWPPVLRAEIELIVGDDPCGWDGTEFPLFFYPVRNKYWGGVGNGPATFLCESVTGRSCEETFRWCSIEIACVVADDVPAMKYRQTFNTDAYIVCDTAPAVTTSFATAIYDPAIVLVTHSVFGGTFRFNITE